MIIGYVDQHDNRDGRCGDRNELLQNRKPLHIRQPSTEKGAGGIHDSRGALMISRRPSSCNMSCLRAFFVALDANLDV